MRNLLTTSLESTLFFKEEHEDNILKIAQKLGLEKKIDFDYANENNSTFLLTDAELGAVHLTFFEEIAPYISNSYLELIDEDYETIRIYFNDKKAYLANQNDNFVLKYLIKDSKTDFTNPIVKGSIIDTVSEEENTILYSSLDTFKESAKELLNDFYELYDLKYGNPIDDMIRLSDFSTICKFLEHINYNIKIEL